VLEEDGDSVKVVVIKSLIIIINNFKAWANWSVPRHLSRQLVMFSPFSAFE
jgi:hypothetical protein